MTNTDYRSDYRCITNLDTCIGTLLFLAGTNACYTERLDAVTKFSGDRSKYEKVIINMEWGAFGDQGSLKDYLTEFDTALDKEDAVKNKREQMYVRCSLRILFDIKSHSIN